MTGAFSGVYLRQRVAHFLLHLGQAFDLTSPGV